MTGAGFHGGVGADVSVRVSNKVVKDHGKIIERSNHSRIPETGNVHSPFINFPFPSPLLKKKRVGMGYRKGKGLFGWGNHEGRSEGFRGILN